MSWTVGDTLEFAAHYQDSDGVSVGPITVSASVYGPAHTLVDSGSATHMAKGVHYYQYIAAAEGVHYCVFETAETTVAARDLATEITVEPAVIKSAFGGTGGQCG